MTHDEVQGWLDHYVKAWESYDPGQIGELFSEDAEYRFHPADEPTRGRQAIVDAWLSPGGDPAKRDAPGTFAAAYAPYAVDDDVAVGVGTSTYWTDASRSAIEASYFNVYLLAFDEAGRCRSFTEYYVKPRKSS
jgi:SnoaL-like domain